jgi:hypothetical protein
VEKCCACGGYLATFLDPDFDRLIMKAAAEFAGNKSNPLIKATV